MGMINELWLRLTAAVNVLVHGLEAEKYPDIDYFCDLECCDVAAMMDKYGMTRAFSSKSVVPTHLTRKALDERVNFLQEELDEFKESVETQDLSGLADALVDLVYIAKGTAVKMGLPWGDLWEEVHRANMTKIIGKTERSDHDLIKPAGWKPPEIEAILAEAGYDKTEWLWLRSYQGS